MKTGDRDNGTNRQTSLTMHIVNGYTQMTVKWMLAILFVMTIVFIGIGVFEALQLFEPVHAAVAATGDMKAASAAFASGGMPSSVLRVSDGALLHSMDWNEPPAFDENSLPIGFSNISSGLAVFWTYRIPLGDGAIVLLRLFFDIDRMLFELVFLFGGTVLVMAAALLSIYLRGEWMTRHALSVIDDLTEMAGSISSRNLNVRINTGDASEELVNLAITFNKMMDRLQASYEKQNRFVSDASHELRTPISVIQGYARMLERWGKDDKEILEEAIAAIRKESISMQDLVEKLLFIARNDRDTLLLVRKTFDLGELVDELVRDTELLETGHQIESEIENGISVHADMNRIKQALRVIVDNAIKYTEEGGTIAVHLRLEDGSAVVTVQDNGIGIPEKDLSNIFDRFFRVDVARERNKGGHGLGLSIARIIILRHGGKIRVSSKPGEGTMFSVYLPVIAAGSAGEDRESSEARGWIDRNSSETIGRNDQESSDTIDQSDQGSSETIPASE